MSEPQPQPGSLDRSGTEPKARTRDVIRRHWAFVLLIALALYSTTAAGGAGRRFDIRATPPYVTIFLLDGARQDVVFRELRAGRLPNIAELAKRGATIEKAVTSFPSMTGYAYYPVVTGLDSTRSGVLGLRWFDRKRNLGNLRSYVGTTNDMMAADFLPAPKLLYERFGDQHSWSLNTYANRGVKTNQKAGFAYARAKYRRRFKILNTLGSIPLIGDTLVPDWEQAEDIGVSQAIKDLQNAPKLQWVTLASMDAHHHVAGTDERYAEIIRYADTLIGRYRAASKTLGQEKDRIYVITTDHGAADADKNLDMREALRACCGMNAERDSSTHVFNNQLDQPLTEWFDKDAVVVINGNMLNYLYFSDPDKTGADAWREPLHLDRMRNLRGHDVVERLRNEPALRFVMGWSATEAAAKVYSRDGEATIREVDGRYAYAWKGRDPFEYEGDPRVAPLLDGLPHDSRDWLHATYDTRFPDSVFRVHRLMTAPGAADITVTAADGWDLGKDYEVLVHNYRGGHGGLTDEQMRIWYVIAGPGLRHGATIATARNEDVGATLFALLGLELEPEANGRVLLELLASDAPGGRAVP